MANPNIKNPTINALLATPTTFTGSAATFAAAVLPGTGEVTVVDKIVFTNTNSAVVTVTASTLKSGGSSVAFLSAASIGAGVSEIFDGPLVLNENDILTGLASLAGVVNVTTSGRKMS